VWASFPFALARASERLSGLSERKLSEARSKAKASAGERESFTIRKEGREEKSLERAVI
jgi:hypothetical protein